MGSHKDNPVRQPRTRRALDGVCAEVKASACPFAGSNRCVCSPIKPDTWRETCARGKTFCRIEQLARVKLLLHFQWQLRARIEPDSENAIPRVLRQVSLPSLEIG